MICKRCEQYIPWNSRHIKTLGGAKYCRHCHQANVASLTKNYTGGE
jgi:hypothetical protein